jgi:hypothetical protein
MRLVDLVLLLGEVGVAAEVLPGGVHEFAVAIVSTFNSSTALEPDRSASFSTRVAAIRVPVPVHVYPTRSINARTPLLQ